MTIMFCIARCYKLNAVLLEKDPAYVPTTMNPRG